MKYKVIYKNVYNHKHIIVLDIVDNLEEAKRIQAEYIEKDADLEFYGLQDDNGNWILEGFVEIEEIN